MKNVCSCFYLVSAVWIFCSAPRALDGAEPSAEVEEGILYRTAEESANAQDVRERCLLDLYKPPGVNGFPTIVFLHGGGLITGERKIPGELTGQGWGVVAAGYRLSPKVKHPVYIEDAAAAVAWTFKNIAQHGGDPERIVVAGFSAGGYLTAMVGLDKSYLATHDIDANRILALLPLSGQMITHQTVRKEQGIEPSKTRPTIDKFAPLYHVRKDASPILCVTGGWEKDMLMRAEENLYFVAMMKLVGHPNIRHVVIEGADHSQTNERCWPTVTAYLKELFNEKK